MPKRIILGHIVSRLINTQIINRFRAPDNIIRQYIIISYNHYRMKQRRAAVQYNIYGEKKFTLHIVIPIVLTRK